MTESTIQQHRLALNSLCSLHFLASVCSSLDRQATNSMFYLDQCCSYFQRFLPSHDNIQQILFKRKERKEKQLDFQCPNQHVIIILVDVIWPHLEKQRQWAQNLYCLLWPWTRRFEIMLGRQDRLEYWNTLNSTTEPACSDNILTERVKHWGIE